MSYGPRCIQPRSVGTRRVKPVGQVGRMMTGLRSAVEQLQKDNDEQFFLEQESSQAFQYLCTQVGALQRGFTTLADAVLEELESVREESARWQEERQAWSGKMKRLGNEVRSKLSDFQHNGAAAAGQSQQLRVEVFHDIMPQLVELKASHAATQQQISEMEAKLVEIKNTVAEVQGDVDRCGRSQRDLKVVVNDTDRHCMATAQELSLAQANYGRLEDSHKEVQEELAKARNDSSEAASALARDMAALAEDARSLRTWCKQLEAGHDTRMKKSEAATAERGEALQKKIQTVIQQQARHSKSVEDIIKSMMEDHSSLHKQTRTLETSLGALRRCASEHHEALLRSCQVFSTSLKIPSPLASSSTLTSSMNLVNSGAISAN
ncbi:hypothetical protein CYMTET_13863 [Cymbomonas tetramitiformis]|uniref:Uncharacterized protein n=1 Tax=Cymbomonas tetramitiformis TaxID=36881 RepID=A0AAE0GH74_9CHLO|nr:hypothetical protein CYMTET_13863 [Cymbomonas tetramitiformis]